MKYNYLTYLTKNIKVQHSELLHDDNVFGGQKVIVYFTNTITGAHGEAVLPTYHWLDKGKLTQEDVNFCNQIMHWSAAEIFQYAREGGIKLA